MKTMKIIKFLKSILGLNKKYVIVEGTTFCFENCISCVMNFQVNGITVRVTTDENGEIIEQIQI